LPQLRDFERRLAALDLDIATEAFQEAARPLLLAPNGELLAADRTTMFSAGQFLRWLKHVKTSRNHETVNILCCLNCITLW
jgi:hypothetical protein